MNIAKRKTCKYRIFKIEQNKTGRTDGRHSPKNARNSIFSPFLHSSINVVFVISQSFLPDSSIKSRHKTLYGIVKGEKSFPDRQTNVVVIVWTGEKCSFVSDWHWPVYVRTYGEELPSFVKQRERKQSDPKIRSQNLFIIKKIFFVYFIFSLEK